MKKLKEFIELVNFEQLQETLFEISLRDGVNNPEAYQDTTMIDDLCEINKLLNHCRMVNTEKKATTN